jgi:hypothetical protein
VPKIFGFGDAKQAWEKKLQAKKCKENPSSLMIFGAAFSRSAPECISRVTIPFRADSFCVIS